MSSPPSKFDLKGQIDRRIQEKVEEEMRRRVPSSRPKPDINNEIEELKRRVNELEQRIKKLEGKQ